MQRNYSTTPIYYILVLLQGQLDCQKHIIVMKIHGWLLFEVNEMLMLNENAIAAPGPLSHSLTLYALLFALSSGRTFIDRPLFILKSYLINVVKYHHTKLLCFLFQR